MGGAVSTGRNNDDLVDNLLSADYIRTPTVQKLFRAVDRADYFLPQWRKNAYKDLAWKSGNLHLSAPCIYSEVMEGLCLKPNLSFLNLGSGTGYLSTMVGLALGSNGINHGVEIYPDVIEYAYRKVEEFKKYSSAIDEYDLCEPKFIQGNCLCLSSDTLQYDRVYCGGACPTSHINYMKSLIKVGGILVMPVEDQLMQIERTSETTWAERSLLPVSFATLIMPEDTTLEVVNMIDVEPSSLQEICRTVVRNAIRNKINKEFPKLKLPPKRKRVSKKKCPMKRPIIPHLDTSDEGSDGEETHSDRERSLERTTGIQSRSIGAFIDIVLGRIPDARHSQLNGNNTAPPSDPNASTKSSESENKTIEYQESNNSNNQDHKSDANSQEGDTTLASSTHLPTPDTSIREEPSSELPSHSSLEVEPNNGNGTVIARIMIRKRNRDDGIEEGDVATEEECDTEVTSTTPTKNKIFVPAAVTKTKREKFDSGVGDEIVETSSDGEPTQDVDDRKARMDVDSCSSSDEGGPRTPPYGPTQTYDYEPREKHWRTVTVPTYAVDHLLEHLVDETPGEEIETVTIPQPSMGPYTVHMRNRIQELPLPQTLKNYINYYKEF